RYVWCGLYDPEEVAIRLAESRCVPGQIREAVDRLRAEVEKEVAKKRAEEATWPATTDCDRLERGVEGLEARGSILEEDAGLTKSDGVELVTEAYEDAEAEGEAGIVGYCFYHGQDLDRVMKSGDLWLASGDFLGDDERRVEIGRRIQRALQDAGFAV